MTLGSYVKGVYDGFISNADHRTTLTHIPQTENALTDGGYSGSVSTSGSVNSIYAIPSKFFPQRLTGESFGELRQGDFSFAVTSDLTFTVNDEIIFSSGTYTIQDVRIIPFNEQEIVKIIEITKAF